MDALLLARLQFFLTIGFHFIFPPITIGLSWFIVWFMTKYMRAKEPSKKDYYRETVKFWVKIFAIFVAVGIATGLVMEFQFGLNWSEYSRRVGEVFGPALAMEIMFAFFLESIFLAVLLRGWSWERISDRFLWFSSILVALGTTLSAFWILVANSWMQTPAGYVLLDDNYFVIEDIWAVVFNPSTIPRFLHTVNASMINGCFVIIGISAWYILKNRHQEFAKESLKTALTVAFVASILQGILGHSHSVQVALTQPAKFAAQEGLMETQAAAPLVIFALILEDGTVIFELAIPWLLGILTHGDLTTPITGLNDIPIANRPPLMMTFYPFHFMVFLGILFVLFSGIGLFLYYKKKLKHTDKLGRYFSVLAILIMPLPILSNEFGWITAEVGRQPWIVYEVIRTADAVSPTVPPEQVLFSIILFMAIYALILCLLLFLVIHSVKKGPELPDGNEKQEVPV
ncbi:MAG: cytochrome ubiquinol oxidase subunit I [Candidatus Odinarchaeota archaeon]